VVLIISSFTPIRFFGMLVVVSIISCMFGALIILPSLVLRFRFAFLEGGAEKSSSTRPKPGLRVLRRIAMLILMIFLMLSSGSAQGIGEMSDARVIIERSHEVVKVTSFEAVSTLTITDSKGRERIRKSTMASMSMDDGTEKRIVRFLSPAEVKGTGILIYDYPEKSDDMWIYLPALRKTRRIISREKSKSFMGSEFSNANMTAPGLNDFTYNLAGEEELEGKSCYMIESVPKDTDLEDQYGYSRSLSWVDKNSYLVHRTRYFDFDGELFKTISNREFRELEQNGKAYMVTHMYAENHRNGRSSEMVIEQLALTPTKESYFTVVYLEQQ
jgi:outer membrane lipoprotein-sorting protein